MNKFFISALAAVLISGCGNKSVPAQKVESDPPAAPAMVAQTNEPAIQSKITGVAGFNIGDRLPDSYRVTQGSAGQLYYSPEYGTPLGIPPFEDLFVRVNPERVICCIDLYTLEHKSGPTWGDIVDQLTKKYGAEHPVPYAEHQVFFESAGHRVQLTYYQTNTNSFGSLSLEYFDKTLWWNEQERLKTVQKAATAENLKGL